MEAKISFKKTQFLLNLLFACTFIVWLLCDFVKVFSTSITPANHILFESFAMLCLGLLFASVKEPPFLWPLVLGWLLVSGIIGIIFFRGLFTIIGINLLLVFSFLFGFLIQEKKGVVKKA